jgi:hypothetical protein
MSSTVSAGLLRGLRLTERSNHSAANLIDAYLP